MKQPLHPTRRQFLQQTAVTSAACGLAQWSSAAGAQPAPPNAPTPLIDTHAYIGQWPFRHVSSGDANELTAALQNNGATEAWVGTFDALLHKDIAGANERLVEECRDARGCVLRPFGAINPTLPDWEEDVRRCHEQWHMLGIRLHPNYHGYTLDDPRFSGLLKLAASNNLVVQLVAWLDDERHPCLNPPVNEVDPGPIEKVVGATNDLRLVLANAFKSVDDNAVANLARFPNVYFDFARLDPKISTADIAQAIPFDRIVVGSTAPLMRLDSATPRLHASQLQQDQINAIRYQTARKLAPSAAK